MKKALVLFTALLMVAAMFAGCGQPATPAQSSAAQSSVSQSAAAPSVASSAAAPAEKVKIGISFYNLTAQYNANLKDAIYKYIEDNKLTDKVDIMFMDGTDDPVKQNTQVDSLIAEKCQAIILNAGDKDAQVTAVKACVAAKIPCIELCSSTTAVDLRTTYVGSEDIVSGVMLATQLCKLAGGKGDLVELDGPTGITPMIRRQEGLMKVLKDNPDVKIVATKVCNWSRAEAMTAVENILQSGMNVDIIYAENDEMAMGALKAIQGSGIKKDIIIGGIDAIPDAVQAVLDGELDCTVFQDAVGQATKAIEVAILAAQGQTIDKLYDIPYKLVLKDNAAEFLPKK
jgi:ABC-type sugar transport system substrate-binding protein